jgi:acetyl-CoA C-acetyltransferase
MREVAILGIGQTRVYEHWEKSLRELAGDAALAALHETNLNSVESLYVGNMLAGSAYHQQHLGADLADWIGMRYIEAIHLESACSSGSAAFRAALMAVASGEVDTAMAIGVEKMTDSPGTDITSDLATAADADWEATQGLSFLALNALIMQRYMHEYGWQHRDFAAFSMNAHANAVSNPNARFQKAITEKEFLEATLIAAPINIMDASPIGDGAAAAILVPLDRVKGTTAGQFVKVLASTAFTDTIAVHSRKDPLWLLAAERSARQAYQQAGITRENIDVFELHDAFSIMAALSLEACGFAERGQAPRLANDGEITPKGRIPIATLGGLKARGHPVGATGMYQILEVVQQLTLRAGATQVEGARIGMTQNIGGSGSNIVTHILQVI